jgi:hypothetical protein
MLRFFKIGFLWRKEFDVVSSELSAGWGGSRLLLPVCSGPYSQVTSQSLSLSKSEYLARLSSPAGEPTS